MRKRIIHFFIMKCSEATLEMEKKKSNKISLLQDLRLRFHILSCKWYSSYYKKLNMMDDFLKKKSSKKDIIYETQVKDLKDKIKKKFSDLK